MRHTKAIATFVRVLWLAGLPLGDAEALALRLYGDGYYAARGLADGTAFVVTEEALRQADLPYADATSVAWALGQQGYRIIERGQRSNIGCRSII